jgi:hypothetical protein
MEITGTKVNFEYENETGRWLFHTTIHRPLVSLQIIYLKTDKPAKHSAWSWGIINNQIEWNFPAVDRIFNLTPEIKQFAQDKIDQLVKLKVFL